MSCFAGTRSSLRFVSAPGINVCSLPLVPLQPLLQTLSHDQSHDESCAILYISRALAGPWSRCPLSILIGLRQSMFEVLHSVCDLCDECHSVCVCGTVCTEATTVCSTKCDSR